MPVSIWVNTKSKMHFVVSHHKVEVKDLGTHFLTGEWILIREPEMHHV